MCDTSNRLYHRRSNLTGSSMRKSPTSLSVNYPSSPKRPSNFAISTHGPTIGSTMIMESSPSNNSIHGSIASSINDITYETEQLERAIRRNDVRHVRKMLQLFNNSRYRDYDRISTDSRSLMGDNGMSKESKHNGTGRTDHVPLNRRESEPIIEHSGEAPSIFANALHLAVEHGASDVVVLLLRSGFDPNESGLTPYDGGEAWRRNSNSSCGSTVAGGGGGGGSSGLAVNRNNSFCASREQLLPQSYYQSSNSPHLLSPVSCAPPPQWTSPTGRDANHYVRYSLPSDANSSANSDVSSIGRNSSPTKFIRMRTDLKPELSTVYKLPEEDPIGDSKEGQKAKKHEARKLGDGSAGEADDGVLVSYEDEYAKENLFTLPPLFMAVALKNAQIVRDLIKFGANVNFQDKHKVTALHLCLCQERISRTCVHLLVANGARINAKNVLGVSPVDLLMSKGYQLSELQKLLIDRAFSVFQSNQHPSHQPLQTSSSSAGTGGGGTGTGNRSSSHHQSGTSSSGLCSSVTTPATSKVTPTTIRPDPSSNSGGGGGCGGGESVSGVEPSMPQTDPSSSISETRQVFSDEALADDKDLDLLHLCGSLASVNQPNNTASSSRANNFLRKLKPTSKGRKAKKAAKLASTNSNGLDVYLCLEDISSDGPSSSSHQARESAFETSSTKGDTSDALNYEESFDNQQLSQTSKTENCLTMVINMASNMECFPYIIDACQSNLSSIIKKIDTLTDSSMDKLITRLLNKLLQAILNEIGESNCGLNQKRETNSFTAKDKMRRECSSSFDERLFTSRLCPLLVTSIECLQGGQSLQYTALLMINKMIDVMIVYGTARTVVPLVERHANDNVNGKPKSSKFADGKRRAKVLLSETRIPSFQSKVSISKEAFLRETTESSGHSKMAKEAPKKAGEVKFSVARGCKRRIAVVKEKPKAKSGDEPGKVSGSRRGSIRSYLTYVGTSKSEKSSDRSGGVNCSGEKRSKPKLTSPLMILEKSAVDLLLNVLNNAITLHKRVQGCRQLCTPSHRWRHCTTHCLQILSARALLFVSQSKTARQRFVDEGPLKILISSLDSTLDPHLICLILQIVALIAIEPMHQTRLVESELPDTLMQLILPSDEWFYTNHSTKYAKFVKHHAARILVYIGLEKRLRNKVYLFDLLEEATFETSVPPPAQASWQSQQSTTGLSDEDHFIIKTCTQPTQVVMPGKDTPSGASLEGIVLDMVVQVEKKIIFGDTDETVSVSIEGEDKKLGEDEIKPVAKVVPPSIQVDFVASLDRGPKSNHLRSMSTTDEASSLSNHFYFTTLPISVNPLVVLRLIQHRMFGCISFWSWPSTAASRSSVASSFGENRSRAGSTCVANLEDSLMRARKSVVMGVPQLAPVFSSNSNKLEVDRRSVRSMSTDEKWSLLSSGTAAAVVRHRASLDRTISETTTSELLGSTSGARKSFKFANFKNKRTKSNDINSPTIETCDKSDIHHPYSSSHHQTHSQQTSSTKDEIASLQRELQNIPRNETPPLPSIGLPNMMNAFYSSALSSYLYETMKRSMDAANCRQRSCSVPRVSIENGSLHIPGLQHHRGSSPAAAIFQGFSSLPKPSSMSGDQPSINPQPANNRSPASLSPSSIGKSHHFGMGVVGSVSSNSNRSINQKEEPIMPNAHKAILSLLLEWSREAPADLKRDPCIRRELSELLSRISLLGEQYQWKAEEIRISAELQDVFPADEDFKDEVATHDEYSMLQQLVTSSSLLCSKEEACALAGIQLRIEETSLTNKASRINMIGDHSDNFDERNSPLIGLKLKPIFEDSKETSSNAMRNEKEATKKSSGSRSISGSDEKASNLMNTMSDMGRRSASLFRNFMSSNLRKNDVTGKGATINLRECLPATYCSAKGIAKAIKEQKRKLFHSQIYENEVQLKKLYIQTCKRLPAYGCQMFQVKEILKGKTSRRRVTRLLGLGLQQIVLLDSKTLTPAKCQPTRELQEWRISGGNNHDRIILEFRATKWLVAATSQGSLQAIGNTLWGIMQDIDSHFLSDLLLIPSKEDPRREFFLYTPIIVYKKELELLQSILHFPEEVAQRLSDVEYNLFYSVPPVDYIRYLTTNLNVQFEENKESINCPELFYNASDISGYCQLLHGQNKEYEPLKGTSTVQDLVKRFNEVSSWITHIIISQATHEDRKAILSCIIRVAQYCWNTGSFNTAMEIVAGLKSEKLRPFWLSMKENETSTILEHLSKALLFRSKPSKEYRDAVKRALNIPHSKVIPFFGNFLRDLYTIFNNMPSLVVLPTYYSLASTPTDRKPEKPLLNRLEFISDYSGEDRFMSRIGVGGIINIEKMKKAQTVLENIKTFHTHASRREKVLNSPSYFENLGTTTLSASPPPNNGDDSFQNCEFRRVKEDDSFYEINLSPYMPIQSFLHNHGVSYVPINEKTIDLHVLQSMNRGATVIHYEEDSGKSCCVYLQLEKSNALLAWCKPPWSSSRIQTSTSSTDYQLNVNIEETIVPSVFLKHQCKEPAIVGLEEGFVDLLNVKSISIGRNSIDQATVCRRFGLKPTLLDSNCFVSLLCGVNLSDNRLVHFIMPKMLANIWAQGLKVILNQLQLQKNLSDQRVCWLKSKYLQLYYQNEACVGPTPAEAIKAFGGRKWTLDAVGGSVQSNIDLISKRTSSFGLTSSRLRKKNSPASMSTGTVRDSSPKSMSSITLDYAGSEGADGPGRGNNRSKASPLAIKRAARLLSLSTSSSHKSSIKSDDVHLRYRFNTQATTIDEPSSPTFSQKSLAATSPLSMSLSSGSSSSSSSEENLNASSLESSPPIHTSSLTFSYREKSLKKSVSAEKESARSGGVGSAIGGSPEASVARSSVKLKPSITHSSQMNFIEFMELYKSFLIRSRKDIKDLFENLASKTDVHSVNEDQETFKLVRKSNPNSIQGIITQNFLLNEPPAVYSQRSRICDAIASASIVANCTGVDTMHTLLLTVEDFQSFLRTYQNENPPVEEVKRLIAIHEPDPSIRQKNCLSFEGFACYLMDKSNYSFSPELLAYDEEGMNAPLSHYYIATSHNTYLTGHQLKGESSVDLYSQVLRTGCRCVELDCYDGDDGMPVIYHGHTLTSKIPFRKVVEAINENAFVASPFPVILSIENHCSLQQQAKMAQTFIQIFGEKLVTKFLFEADFTDDPHLPSPNQLKYRILIKNKKLRAPVPPLIPSASSGKAKLSSTTKSTPHRTNSLISAASTGSLNEDEDDYDEDEDDEDVTEPPEQTTFAVIQKGSALRTESSSSQEGGSSTGEGKASNVNRAKTEVSSEITEMSMEQAKSISAVSHKVVRKSNSQVAPELSDLVIYCQAIKFHGFTQSDQGACSPTSTVKEPVKKVSSRKNVLSPIASGLSGGSPSASAISPMCGDSLTIPSFQQSSLSMSSSSGVGTSLGPTGGSNSLSGGGPGCGIPSSASSTMASVVTNRRPHASNACYQVASLNEYTAKKLCRKHPLAVISHTESQLMRSYPAGMRIDSSNFNPVIFWAFGIQMVALNYQTEDAALAINKAMFEQNGLCGCVLKPLVMRDRNHVMFERFNPWDKEFDGLYAIDLTVTVISGQYVCPDIYNGSPQVEVEIIGIPVDCNKQRTKLVQRNSLNPIWNDTFVFRVTFADLAFIRFTVIDMGTNHVASQRVVPIKSLKQGYRHLRLKSPQNQALPLSSLFIYSSSQEEGIEIGAMLDFPPSDEVKGYSLEIAKKLSSTSNDFSRFDSRDNINSSIGTAPIRRRMFFLVVHGVVSDEASTILKITQESTTKEVIVQALTKAGKSTENVSDFVLIEEVAKGWDKKGPFLDRNATTQRILDPEERPLEAQANWKGEGRFMVKKISDDPSSRAWFNTIKAQSLQKERLKRRDSDEFSNSWGEEMENFLVCVYNVSEDQPYAILKASVSGTAQDIISQALLKARKMEDSKNFVLVEELEIDNDSVQGGSNQRGKHRESTATISRRVLDSNENVYSCQAAWKGKGLFRLARIDELTSMSSQSDTKSSPNIGLSSRALYRITRSTKDSIRKYKSRSSNKDTTNMLSTLHTTGSGQDNDGSNSTTATATPIIGFSPRKSPRKYNFRFGHAESRSLPETAKLSTTANNSMADRSSLRHIRSEGETVDEYHLSDEDESGFRSNLSFAKLKRLSLRKFRAWRGGNKE